MASLFQGVFNMGSEVLGWGSGVLGFWRSGVLGFWGSGILGFWGWGLGLRLAPYPQVAQHHTRLSPPPESRTPAPTAHGDVGLLGAYKCMSLWGTLNR